MKSLISPTNYLTCPLLIMLLAIVLQVSCKEKTKTEKPLKTYEVKLEQLHKKLHFTGIIQPLQENSLTVPMDAIVDNIHVRYGQTVKKNDVIVTLNSAELQKQYNDTLTEYLKAKDNYAVARTKFSGTQELWAAGLISKNNFLSEKSSLNTARMALVQVTRKLTEMLEKMDSSMYQNFSTLSFAQFDKVRLALNTKHNLIRLKSSVDGILLYPPKSGDDKKERLIVGKTVKTGEVLALIGDLSGIRVEISIPEVDIYKIKHGMPAVIRSVANPGASLDGKLVAVNAQASATSNSTLPSFSAVVEVRQLTPSQQSWIKVGMSAEIELAIDNSRQLMVPIAAVQQKQGQKIVQVMEHGQLTPRIVTTGMADADKVVIAKGLKPGDIVAYH